MTIFVMTKYDIMNDLALFLRQKRQELDLSTSVIAQACSLDQSLISRYEGGTRLPTEQNLSLLAEAYNVPYKLVRKLWLASKVVYLLEGEDLASEILVAAEDRLQFLRSNKSTMRIQVSDDLHLKLEEIDALHGQWKKRKPLNATQLRKMKEYFNIQYTYDSNRIEGNTLTLQETMLVIEEGVTISGKSMREHLEAINHAEAIEFAIELSNGKLAYNKRSLFELHSLILKSIDRENAGRFRKVPVYISGSDHVPPQPYDLEIMIENYFSFYDINRRHLHPVLMAAELHERLVSIHPFIDGNGRTSRLVMNFYLLQNGYTITSLKGDINSKLAYYDALEKCRKDENREAFYHLIADNVLRSLKEHLAMT